MSRNNDLIDMIDASQAGYEKYEPTFAQLTRQYLSQMDTEIEDSLKKRGKSHIFFPKINAKTKRIVVSFQESYFNTDTFAKVKASNPNNQDEVKKAEALQGAVDYYTQTKMTSLFKTFTPTFYYAPILGTVGARVYWDGEKPQIDNCQLKDLRFDPSARTVDDIRYYVHDIYVTADDIKRYQRAGIYKRHADITPESMVSEAFEDDTTIHSRIKLQEVYTQNAKGEWTVSTFYDRSVTLRQDVVLQDGNPFILGGLIPQIESPDEDDSIVRAYYDSPIGAIVPIQQEVNVRKNQQIDAIKRQLEPQIMIPTMSGLNPTDVERGARYLRIKNPMGINIIPAPDPRAASVDMEALEFDMSENIGVSAQQNGIGSDTKQTATESSILSNEGNARIQGYMRSFNETFFKPIFERISQLVWKYGDDLLFAGVSRDDDFDFIARINTGLGATNKEIQLAGIEKSFGMINGLFNMAMQVQDGETAQQAVKASGKLVREALPLMGIENVEDYLGEEDGEQLGNGSESARPTGIAEIAGLEDGTAGANEYERIALPTGIEQHQDIRATQFDG